MWQYCEDALVDGFRAELKSIPAWQGVDIPGSIISSPHITLCYAHSTSSLNCPKAWCFGFYRPGKMIELLRVRCCSQLALQFIPGCFYETGTQGLAPVQCPCVIVLTGRIHASMAIHGKERYTGQIRAKRLHLRRLSSCRRH